MDSLPMKGLSFALLLATVVLCAPPAKANVYKCNINGETHYQDEPCPGDRDAKPHLEFESEAPVSRSEDSPAPTQASGREGNGPHDPPAQVAAATPGAGEEDPPERAAVLGADIARAQGELREVVDARRAALAAIDVRMAGQGESPALLAERQQLEAEFRQRRHEVSERLRGLQAELAAECPNGTFMNGTRLACR